MQIIVCMTVLFPDVFPLFSCFHAVCFLRKLLVTFERFRIRFRISTQCTKKYIFFFQMFRKDGLSKKIALDCDLSCIIWKDICFFPKTWSYSLDRKWKMIFLKKLHGNVIFISNVLKRWSFQKKSLSDIAFQWKKRKLNI